jgi:hypothetical protein
MKYEFHVGDYVETKDGDIGIITEVNDVNTNGGSCWYCTSSRGTRTEKHTYIIPVGTDVDMARVFKRIGQYDFTKKDNDKIKPLPKEYNDLYSKINELVEAVNQLEEKVNGMT